jgi:hypothetical protein
MSATHPGIGHNAPPLAEILSPAIVDAQIETTVAPLRARAFELTESCKRFALTYPTIETPEADSKAAEVLAVCARFTTGKTGRVDAARIALKAPLLEATRMIDGDRGKAGPFGRLIDDVNAAAQVISRASIAYKQKVESETRRKAQEEATRLAEQARMAEELAAKGSGMVTMEDAATAYQAADDSQRVADSKAADLTRIHGSDVGTTSLRYRRVVTVIEPDKVPRMYCVPDLAAITRAAGRAGTPFPKIDGVSISDEPDLTVRR